MNKGERSSQKKDGETKGGEGEPRIGKAGESRVNANGALVAALYTPAEMHDPSPWVGYSRAAGLPINLIVGGSS